MPKGEPSLECWSPSWPPRGRRLAPASRLTDEEGEAQALWTLGGRSGTQSARIDAEDLARAPLSAIAAPAAAARLAFESVPAAAVAGIVLSPPVVVAVQARYGNLVPTSSTDIQLHLSRGTLVGAGPGSAIGGRATFGGLHIDEPGTGYVLSASAEGLTGTQTEPFPVATGTAAELLAAAGDGQEAAAGSPVAISPEVLVRDADGNGIAGVSVTFTVTNGGGSVAPGSVVTGNDGRAASDGWTLGTAAGANPAQIQDVKCAIRHLRARAAEYGLDPDRIGAWGGSAGGQLVALLGSADAAVGFDGVGEFQGISSEVQAVIAISAITSPDELRDNYSRAFRTWPDLHAGHSLEPVSGPIDPAPETITTRMAAFLDQHLR